VLEEGWGGAQFGKKDDRYSFVVTRAKRVPVRGGREKNEDFRRLYD